MAENLQELENQKQKGLEVEGQKDKEQREAGDDKLEKKGPDRNELLRELSKEYGVNLFDAEGIKEFKQYQDSQKTEIEKIREELENTRLREEEAKKALENQKLNLLRVQHRIDEKKFNDFLAIATAKVSDTNTIEQAFEQTVKEYGSLFVTQGQKGEIQLGIETKGDDQGNENVKTFDQQVYESYLKRKK